MAADEARQASEGAPARLFAGSSFGYAFVAAVLVLVVKDFFRNEPDQDAMLLWLLVPLIASFGGWMSVMSGQPLLRGWLWFGIVAILFCCWIAVFSYGLLFLPVALLMMVAAVSPWDKRVGS